jgi:opacity protein-like surface antigen
MVPSGPKASMKTLLALYVVLATLAAEAQSTNAPQPQAVSTNNVTTGGNTTTGAGVDKSSLKASSSATASRFNLEPQPTPKPNEIVKGNVTFSGSAVEVVKTKRPLQLLNPLAPPQYGSPEDNVARDPANGKVTGLKIFAIKF